MNIFQHWQFLARVQAAQKQVQACYFHGLLVLVHAEDAVLQNFELAGAITAPTLPPPNTTSEFGLAFKLSLSDLGEVPKAEGVAFITNRSITSKASIRNEPEPQAISNTRGGLEGL